MSARLERAVLRSAWPDVTPFRAGVVPVPGEVDARFGRSRDVIRVRVPDPSRIRVGQPVVAGDVYIGEVIRVSFRERPTDGSGLLRGLARKLRLTSARSLPPRDAVDVALITGGTQRVGGLVPKGQDGRPCRMVVGGLAWPQDRVWLAVHTPESRATTGGTVIVNEPQGLASGFDSLAEGFLLGELRTDYVRRDGAGFVHEVKGVEAPLDFDSGLNQVLILTRAGEGPAVDLTALRANASVIPVLGDGGWAPARLLAVGDTNAWRSTCQISAGRGAGVRDGAAVVDGHRILGRVVRPSRLSACVATLDDPGLTMSALAQCVSAPDASPLAMGSIVSEGRAREGGIAFRWIPDPGTREPDWMSSHGPDEPIEVVLWTGSGMVNVPRGLRIGRTSIRRPSRSGTAQGESPAESETPGDVTEGAAREAPEGQLLVLKETAQLAPALRVRVGGGRLRRPAADPLSIESSATPPSGVAAPPR